MKSDKLVIANKTFKSRLIVGTGKYKNMSECAKLLNFQVQTLLQLQLEE